MNMRDVENTIYDLENGVTNFDTCNKLASLYIIRDHAQGSNSTPATVVTEPSKLISLDSETDFAHAVNSMDSNDVMKIMDELMTTLQVVNPRLYNGVMNKLT